MGIEQSTTRLQTADREYRPVFILRDRFHLPNRRGNHEMTVSREVTVEAFCSTANLGAGFDVFGLALDKYSDKIRVRLTQASKVKIIAKGLYARQIPKDVRKNSAGPPATALLRRARVKKGLEIMIEKDVPLGLGLGSSGATAAACTKALDHLLELKLSNDELVRVASLGEKAVTGTAHPDNVAASLIGGFVIVVGYPFKTISIKPPSSLAAVVVTPILPRRDNKTRLARKVVPRSLEVKKAVLNIGRASAIATGFAKGDIEMIGSGMEDEIAEPYRQEFLPGYRDAKKAAIDALAAGASISGAGPSIIALVNRTRHPPRPVANAMVRAFARNKVRSTFFIARPAIGARVIGRN